jgi:low affinity Fe/Cu permease
MQQPESRSPANELNGRFDHFASHVAKWTGRSVIFLVAVLITALWAVSGPLFHYSNGWQLVINTGTTVLTFLMVFIIQNTMNRESAALHLKLDELVKVTREAHNDILGAEKLTEGELTELARKR